jgi:hypothetical protein
MRRTNKGGGAKPIATENKGLGLYQRQESAPAISICYGMTWLAINDISLLKRFTPRQNHENDSGAVGSHYFV